MNYRQKQLVSNQMFFKVFTNQLRKRYILNYRSLLLIISYSLFAISILFQSSIANASSYSFNEKVFLFNMIAKISKADGSLNNSVYGTTSLEYHPDIVSARTDLTAEEKTARIAFFPVLNDARDFIRNEDKRHQILKIREIVQYDLSDTLKALYAEKVINSNDPLIYNIIKKEFWETKEAQDPNKAKIYLSQLGNINNALYSTLKSTSLILESRINTLGANGLGRSMAAGSNQWGDFIHTNKAWGQAFVSTSSQRGGSAFKSSQYGFTTGVDVETETLNHNAVVGGIALTHTKITLQNKTADNNTLLKSNINLISLYGSREINQHLFLTGSVSYGQADIYGLGASTTTSGKTKHKAELIKTNLNLGYVFNLEDNIYVIPKLTTAYDFIMLYTSKADQPITQKAERLTIGTALSVGKKIQSNHFVLHPECHIGIEQIVKQEDGNIYRNLNKLAQTPNIKSPKTLYNIGLSMQSLHHKYNIQVGYDYYFQDKYQAHSGLIKMELYF